MYTLDRLTLNRMIELSAARYASRQALSLVGGVAFTYADVDALSAKLSGRLAAHGIVPDDRVAIVAENSPHWGVACFAVIRAGAIVVPILVDFTAEQIANIIGLSGAKAVLCSPRQRARLSKLEGKVLMLELSTALAPDELPPPEENAQAPKVRRDPDDTALIVYTSGTTGLSKGVVLSHKNILSNALACRSIIVLHRLDRLLSILPLAHTYEFTIGFMIPFLAGSHIHYLDRPPSATVLLPALQAVKPTIMLSVPLVIEKIYRTNIKPTLEGMKLYSKPIFKSILIRFAGIKLKKTFGGHLRFFGVGGAPLAADVEEFLKKARFPYAIGYGLTETAPLIAGCNPKRTHLRSTGPALAGVKMRIADPRPDSGEGEIQVQGDNVFKGYFKDPERTKEAFTSDGWFRTGDLGYVDEHRRVFVRGRLKTMILGASGENIYPEEVEAVLNQSPYVAESLVVEEDSGLTAFVYLKSEVLENIEAAVQDRVEAAGVLSGKLGEAIAHAERSIGHAIGDAEKSGAKLLETIRREANEKLSSFSKIRKIKLKEEPFEKTPTQKIKRFLYTKTGGDRQAKDGEAKK